MTDALLADDACDSEDLEASSPSSSPILSKKEFARKIARHCHAYRGAIPSKAAFQLVSTLLLFAATVSAMLWTVQSAYWITLLLAIPAGGILVRLFTIQHDCGHGSFFKTEKMNTLVGHGLSLLTITPYQIWRREHAQHHATSGDLDHRGVGDISTLTVDEYKKLSPLGKFGYQIYRNPLFLFGLGVPFFFLVLQRVPFSYGVPFKKAWQNIMGLNLGLAVLYSGLIWLFGWSSVLFVAWPILHLATAIGGWLFFIQHQFEETHWDQNGDWDFQVAAVFGSSYYDLPAVLNWFTGHIGLHHIHHLNSMIPNYRLADCLNACPELKELNRLTIWDSLKCAGLKLWDEDQRRMIAFSEVR